MLRRPEKLWRYLAEVAVCLPVDFALTLPSLRVMGIPKEWPYALLLLTIFQLLYSLLRRMNARARSVGWIAVLGVVFLLSWRGGLFNALEMIAGAFALPRPLDAIFRLYGDQLLLLWAFMLPVSGRALVMGEAAFSAPTLLAGVTMLWFAGDRQSLQDFIPLALALPMLFIYSAYREDRPGREANTRSGKGLARALPVAIVITLLAFLLTPAKRTTDPAMEKQADRLRQYINDHFFFTASRENFSLASMGYQPMGEAGLGGKPQISNAPVLEVETRRKIYLRGTMLDFYTGRSWVDTLSRERYGYTAQRFTAHRDRLMNLSLPEVSLRLPQEEADVRILADLPSTLFTPQRLRSLDLSEGMVPYLNASSEMFITRNLAPGDSYQLSYEPYVAGTRRTDELAKRLSGHEDEGLGLLPESYLQLPKHLTPGGSLEQLAREIVGIEQDPYQQAALLRDYLKSHYHYTLDVKTPPENLDFAQHFLFDTGEGYCTYFATAMAVLSRSIGLPSRYIEGFVALPAEDGGPVIITGQQAHAWAEVYIPALGWVTFDATSTTGEMPPPPSESETPPPDGPEPTPTPEEEEAPTPSPAPEDAPAETPRPTETPQPTDQPQPTEAPEKQDGERLRPPVPKRPIWLLWLLLILLIALVILRTRAAEPHRRAAKAKTEGDRLLIYWQAYAGAMAAKGQPIQKSETLYEYAQRIAPKDQGLEALAEALSAHLYGKKAPDKETLTKARLYYQDAWRLLPAHQKAALYMKRGWAYSIEQLKGLNIRSLFKIKRP